MKLNYSVLFGALGMLGMLAVSYSAAQSPGRGKGEAALAHAASTNKTVCLVFYRDWDAQCASMGQAVKAHAEKYSDHATWNVVQVSDAAEKSIVDRFQLSRAPMPMVVTIHPNGAVTGFFPGKVAEADLVRTLVSPKKAECMKLLQEGQLVLICVKATPNQLLPQAVQQFQSDPMFAKKTKIVAANAGDPNEAAFYSELKLPAGQSTTVFLAPPGVLVGRFTASATMSDLAAALHAAGKCCDDKNCKHKH